MPKFAEVKNRELKTILSSHKLPTSGTKAEMVHRLYGALYTDEISNDELVSTLLRTEPPTGGDTDNIGNVEQSGNANENDAEPETDTTHGAENDVEEVGSVAEDQYSISSRVSYRQPRYKFSVKEISETIPEYDPTNVQSMSAEHFVDHAGSALSAYGFDTKCLLLAVYSLLKGVARLWLDGQRQLFTSWEDFKTEFLEEFGQDLDEAEINDIMAKTNAIAVMKFNTMRHMRKTLEDYENNMVGAPRYANENRPNKRTTKEYVAYTQLQNLPALQVTPSTAAAQPQVMQMQSTPIAAAVQRKAMPITGIMEAEQQRNLMCTNATGQENYTSQRAEMSLMNMTGGVKEIGKIMPEFNPSKATSSRAFIYRINQLRAAYGWSDQMVLYAIHDKLKGPAKQWINAKPVFSVWEGFVQAFSIDFPSDINQAEINMQMMRSRIGRSESYVYYFYRMLALGRSISLSDESIITGSTM